MVSFIEVEGRTLRGVFQKRRNRFLALVRVEDRILPSFLPNPGRMHELLTPGTEVILREVMKEDRKTDYDLIGVFYNGQVVSVDSRVPNKLVLGALRNGDIEELLEYNLIKPEYGYGHARAHVRDLVKAKKEGYRACVLFVVQRTDVHVFAPNDETDPEFGKVLRDAAVEGVGVYAYYSEFVGNNITLKGKVKVELKPY